MTRIIVAVAIWFVLSFSPGAIAETTPFSASPHRNNPATTTPQTIFVMAHFGPE